MFLYKSIKNKLRTNNSSNNNNNINNNNGLSVFSKNEPKFSTNLPSVNPYIAQNSNLKSAIITNSSVGSNFQDLLLSDDGEMNSKRGRSNPLAFTKKTKNGSQTKEMNSSLSKKYNELTVDPNREELFASKKKIYAVDDIDVKKVKWIFTENVKKKGSASELSSATDTENESEKVMKKIVESKSCENFNSTPKLSAAEKCGLNTVEVKRIIDDSKCHPTVYTTDLQDCVPSSTEKKKRVSFEKDSNVFDPAYAKKIELEKISKLNTRAIGLEQRVQDNQKELDLKYQHIKELKQQSAEVINRNIELRKENDRMMEEMLAKYEKERKDSTPKTLKPSRIPIRKSLDSPYSVRPSVSSPPAPTAKDDSSVKTISPFKSTISTVKNTPSPVSASTPLSLKKTHTASAKSHTAPGRNSASARRKYPPSNVKKTSNAEDAVFPASKFSSPFTSKVSFPTVTNTTGHQIMSNGNSQITSTPENITENPNVIKETEEELNSSSDSSTILSDDSSVESSIDSSELEKHFGSIEDHISKFRRNLGEDDILKRYEEELKELKREKKLYAEMKERVLRIADKRAEMKRKKERQLKKKKDANKKVSTAVRRYNQYAKSLREKLIKKREMEKEKCERSAETSDNSDNNDKEFEQNEVEKGNQKKEESSDKQNVDGQNKEENVSQKEEGTLKEEQLEIEDKKDQNRTEILDRDRNKTEAKVSTEMTKLNFQVNKRGWEINKKIIEFKTRLLQQDFKPELSEKIKKTRLEIESNLKTSFTEDDKDPGINNYLSTVSDNIKSTDLPSSPADKISSSSSFSSLCSLGGDFGCLSPKSIIDDYFDEVIQSFELESMIQDFKSLNLDEDQKNTLFSYCVREIRELFDQHKEKMNGNASGGKVQERNSTHINENLDKEFKTMKSILREKKKEIDVMREKRDHEKKKESQNMSSDGIKRSNEKILKDADTADMRIDEIDETYKEKGLLRFFLPEKYLKETSVFHKPVKEKESKEPLPSSNKNQTAKKKRKRRKRRKKDGPKEMKGKKEKSLLCKIDEWEQFVTKYEQVPTPTKNLNCETIKEEEETNSLQYDGYEPENEDEDEDEPELREILEKLNKIELPKPIIKNQWLWNDVSEPSDSISERHYQILQEHVRDCFYRYDTNNLNYFLNKYSLEKTLFNENDTFTEDKCEVNTASIVNEKGEFITPPDYPAKHTKQYELTDDVILLQDMINNAFGEEYESKIRPQINNELIFD